MDNNKPLMLVVKGIIIGEPKKVITLGAASPDGSRTLSIGGFLQPGLYKPRFFTKDRKKLKARWDRNLSLVGKQMVFEDAVHDHAHYAHPANKHVFTGKIIAMFQID